MRKPSSEPLLRRLAASRPGLRELRRPGPPAFQLRYFRTGPRSSRPVLVVPGGPGLAASLPYAGFRRRAARRGLDLIMIEHRGVGLSRLDLDGAELPPSALTLEAVVEDLAAVLDREGVPSAIVVGSSYGSYVAQGFGVRYPERVEAMVLDSPILSTRDYLLERATVRALLWEGDGLAAAVRQAAATEIDPDDLFDVSRTVYELGGPLLLRRLLDQLLLGRCWSWPLLTRFASRVSTALNPVPYWMEFALVGTIAFRELRYAPPVDGRPFDPARTYAPLADHYPDFAGEPWDLPSLLPDFDRPTVVLSGDRDLRTPQAIARRVAALLPSCTVVAIGNGHSALETHPLALLRVIEQTLAGRPDLLNGAALTRLPRRGLLARSPQLLDAALRLNAVAPRR